MNKIISSVLLGATVAVGAVALASPAAAATGGLASGECLASGASLASSTGLVTLGLQSDGNLVERVGGGAAWSTGTAGTGAANRLCMQTDGNLVLYKGSSALWQSQTAGQRGGALSVQDDGNLVIYKPGSVAVWHNGVVANRLVVGSKLVSGQQLVSAGGAYRAVLQGDGNLVVYKGSVAQWQSGTSGRGASRAIMQSDGNFVLYAGSTATWNARTGGRGGTQVQLQTDGNLVVSAGNTPLWSSRGGTVSSQAQAIVTAARNMTGKGYLFGAGNEHGPTNDRFDCSGLSMYAVYQGTGIVLPHSAASQYGNAAAYGGVEVSLSALQPGDLVFFYSPVSHVGIYVGNGQMIDAPNKDEVVGLRDLYPGLVGAVRYWH